MVSELLRHARKDPELRIRLAALGLTALAVLVLIVAAIVTLA